MNQILRAFTAQVDDVNNAERSITAKISTSTVDRHNTCFDSRGCDLKNYNLNRVVLWEHGRDTVNRGSLPIGTNLWIRVDKSNTPKIIARTKFKKDDFAQMLFEAYRDSEMAGWSLSALPRDFGPPTQEEIRSRPELANVDTVFRTFELCEYSAVSIPSCVDALTIDELRSLSKAVTRGVPISFDVQEAIDRISKPAEQAKDDDGDECEEPGDSCEDADEDEEDEAEVKKKKSRKVCDGEKEPEPKRAVEPVETRDVPESVREIVEEMTEQLRESIIELPPLTGRTFQQVFDALRGEEIEYRKMIIGKMQEHIDWINGKV